jgi:hypothetical protein
MSKTGDRYTSMTQLARINSQDQVEHGYMPLYETLFESMRFDGLNILEIGFSRGRGSRTLAEYFHHSNIHSLELDYKEALPYYEKFPESLKERIKLYSCDQGNKEQLTSFIRGKYTSSFHIVLDDGSHNPEHQLLSWQTLWPTVTHGGLYVIEDLHPYYKEGQHQTINYFLNVIHEINKKGKIKEDLPTPDIEWVMFPNNRVVLRKK